MADETDTMFEYEPPPIRCDIKVLHEQIDMVVHNPILETLLHMSVGLLAVLNDRRQILAVNETLLDALNIEDGREVLGLRPGNVLDCKHAEKKPDGCGTTQFCSSCGAAISIAVCLAKSSPVERMCSIAASDNSLQDVYFRVQAYPFKIEGQKLVLLYLQDASTEIRSSMLERVFFHDMNNLIMSILGNCELLQFETAQYPEIQHRTNRILDTANQLAKEISIQRYITQQERPKRITFYESLDLEPFVNELLGQVESHPEAAQKTIKIESLPPVTFKSDKSLLIRILTNMLINALEAGREGDEVHLNIEQKDKHIEFQVWNAAHIPAKIADRIFHRSFTTKSGIGRGLGTYSMKLLGETCLGGKVSFKTDEEQGTTFTIRLPLK